MLTINNKQIEAFNKEAFKKFEDNMVNHTKDFFPNHFIVMGEVNVRNTINYACLKAKKYGFNTQRNCCLYLNNMLVLGSNFDMDPQYPWAIELLNDKRIPNYRIDKLSDKMIEVCGRIHGKDNFSINKALSNLHNNASEILIRISDSKINDIPELLNFLYPKKYEVVGNSNLNQLTKLAKAKAINYGISLEPSTVALNIFMFLCGAGFDNDPQYPWVSEILSTANDLGEREKVTLLYTQAVSTIELFLDQYKS